MEIIVVSYNIGMGAKRTENLLSKKEAFELLKKEILKEYLQHPKANWFICLQELFRTYYSKNQVIQLIQFLNKATQESWHYRTTTHKPYNKNKEAVAIITNCKQVNTKSDAWWYPQKTGIIKRGTIGYKAKLKNGSNIWVVNTHLLRAGRDKNGIQRIGLVEFILKKLDKTKYPVIICGDFNVYDINENSYDQWRSLHSKSIYENTISKILNKGFTRGRNYSSSEDNRTHTSWSNKLTLDYIFFRKSLIEQDLIWEAEAPEVLNFRESNLYMTDHKGLKMTIKMTSKH